MLRGVHGEKIASAIASDKMPKNDIPRLEEALERYDLWIEELQEAEAETLEELVAKMVASLNTTCPIS